MRCQESWGIEMRWAMGESGLDQTRFKAAQNQAGEAKLRIMNVCSRQNSKKRPVLEPEAYFSDVVEYFFLYSFFLRMGLSTVASKNGKEREGVWVCVYWCALLNSCRRSHT